ncbi:helix-turn-helix domain-containing protein [Cryptosporangium aurantiacum]|uniref:PucR C-terminal helix-turn-helix domain-containing protein n=1 Tax=Cryptosporangium aurantiacum TaxID=134849 RepID=A0A1M7QXV2_9ACTN|nr:helix-turn-helix domain-containing protein [Cryptosporangium aurantiacum]SHN36767.1 PucR C-terminal helix-turn-helix domain-containing protein [Cryptosporangium aurantiacum]
MPRNSVRRAVLAAEDTIGDLVVAEIVAEIPAYRALDVRQLAEVRAIALWVLRRILDIWVEGAELGDDDLARVRGIGAARAADGRPLPSVLRAYRVAATTAIDQIVELVEPMLTVADTIAFARLWLTSFDQLTEAIYEGYSASAERLTADRDRALRDFLDDLLVGRQAHPAAAADRSRALGITLPSPPRLLVAEREPADAPAAPTAGAPDAGSHADGRRRNVRGGAQAAPGPVLRLAQELAAQLCPDGGALSTVRGQRAVLLLPLRDEETIRAALLDHGCRGCAIRPPRPDTLVDAYRLASLALDLAPADAYEGGPLLGESDGYALALLAGRPPAEPETVARVLLGALLDPGQEHVRQGLDAFLAAGSATTAAAMVGLHPQSLRYRLRRVRELTGRDPRRSWDRFVLDLGSRIAASPLGAAPSGVPGD